MGVSQPGPLGPQRHTPRLQTRVYQSSSFKGTVPVNSDPKISRPTPSPGKGDFRPPEEEGYLRRQRFSDQTSSLLLLPHPKEARFLETDNKSQASEQSVHPSQEIQNGDPCRSSIVPTTRLMGNLYRSKGRLSPHPHSPVSSQVPGFQIPKYGFLLPSSSLRPLHCPKGFHKSHQSRSGFPPKTRHPCIRLSRRLAAGGSLSSRDVRSHRLHRLSPRKLGVDHQCREVLANPNSNDHLPRSSPRFPNRYSLPFPSESSHSVRHGLGHAHTFQRSGKNVAPPSRPHGQHGRCYSVLPPLHEANPDSPSRVLLPVSESAVKEGSSTSFRQRSPTLVDASTQYNLGETIQGSQTQVDDHDRCFAFRMGSSLGVGDPVRPMELERLLPPHQPPGTYGRSPSHLQMGSSPQEPGGISPVRQLHDCFLHQPSGRNQVHLPLHQNLGSPSSLPSLQHPHKSLPSRRPGECYGRRSLQREPTGNGVVPISSLGQSHLPDLRQTYAGPVRNPVQYQTSRVLYEVLPSPSLVDRRSSDHMGQPLCLRVPPLVFDSTRTPQAEGVQHSPPPGRPILAQPAVVSSTPGDANRLPLQVSTSNQSSNSGGREDLAPASSTPQSSSLETITQRFTSEGLSQEAAIIASGSRRPSTLSTYDSRLVRFRDWSTGKGLDPLDAPVEAIADFFVTLFNEGKQISTIRNYRSAISSIHKGFPDGSSIGTNTAICHLLKGMFNKRPPRKCLTPSWSINNVLTTLSLPPYEPMHNSTLELLTYKTLFLIAAASARRRSELHALTTKKGFIRFSQSGVFLIPDPSFLTKNETISFTPGEIYLPSISSASSISEDKRVCPVRALKWYLEKTKLIRTSERLFLIPRSPFNPASKDTLSRWLVKLITPHSSPDDPVHAHQLRAHASSKAWFSGVSLDNILRAAAWKTPSTFVACYLSDVISQEGAFARAVLGVPDHRRPVLPPSSQC